MTSEATGGAVEDGDRTGLGVAADLVRRRPDREVVEAVAVEVSRRQLRAEGVPRFEPIEDALLTNDL